MLLINYPAATVAIATIVVAAVAAAAAAAAAAAEVVVVVVVDFPEVAVRNLVQSSCCCQCYPYRLGCLKQNLLLCGFQDWRH